MAQAELLKFELDDLDETAAGQRIGKGGVGDPFRYFVAPTTALQAAALPGPTGKAKRQKRHDEALLAILRDRAVEQ
jgi:hypothetical protein